MASAQSKRPVWYEPHPVSPERKAEIMAAGYRILDAIFMPAGHQNLEGSGLDKSSEEAAGNVEGKQSIADIRAALTAKGVEFDPKAKKADLMALLDKPSEEA